MTWIQPKLILGRGVFRFEEQKENVQMTATKTLALALGIAFGASGLALAQQGNPSNNAAASGGSGTHQSAQKTGSAANNQKVLHNQNGYRPMRSMRRQ